MVLLKPETIIMPVIVHTGHALLCYLWFYIGQFTHICQGKYWVLIHLKRMLSYGYTNPHYKSETVWRPTQVYDMNPFTDKTVSS